MATRHNRNRPVPEAIPSERTVLAAIIADPDIFSEVKQHLDAEVFYDPRHRTAFEIMTSLDEAGRQPSYLNLHDEVKRRGLDADDWLYLSSLVNDDRVDLVRDWRDAIRNITRAAAQRQVMHIADMTEHNVNADPAETVAWLRQELEGLERRTDAGYTRTFTLAELMQEDLPSLRWIIPGYLPEGLTVLGAKQKIGKSWLAYDAVIAVASGGVVLGQSAEEGDVLYLALEDGKRRLKSRANKLLGERAIPQRVTLSTEARDWRLDAGGIDRIARWLKNHPDARLVVIDVFAKVRPPRKRGADLYLEDYAVMSSLKALADRYHVAVLVVHHTRKASAEDVYDELNGTMGIAGAADTVWILQRRRGEDTGTLHITGREIEEEGQFALRFDKATCAWQVMSEQEVAEQRKRSLTPERRNILDVLENAMQPLRPLAIALALGIPKDDAKEQANLRVLLGKMANDKQIAQPHYGAYCTNEQLHRLQWLQSTPDAASDTDSEGVTAVSDGELQRLQSAGPESNGTHDGTVTTVTTVTSNRNEQRADTSQTDSPLADVWEWPDYCPDSPTRHHEYNGKVNAIGQRECTGCGAVENEVNE